MVQEHCVRSVPVWPKSYRISSPLVLPPQEKITLKPMRKLYVVSRIAIIELV